MRGFAALIALTAATIGLPTAAGAGEPISLPPARVGDAWTIEVVDTPFSMRIAGMTSARDRWGRLQDVADVEVDGFHPLAFEGKQVTQHHLYVDAASGTQIADQAEYIFGEDPEASDRAQYASFEPNNPDGWPGWTLAGGLLAGRTVAPGDTVTLPFVRTGTRGADRITLTIQSEPPSEGAACVRGIGEIAYPLFMGYDAEGWYRSTMRAELDVLHCANASMAREVAVRYSGAAQFEATARRTSFSPGSGTAIGVGGYDEPAAHVAAVRVPFDGRLRDGGQLPMLGLEAAQDAAALAPGLMAWRAVHPDAYLVEAEFLAAEMQGSLPIGDGGQWRLVYAAPSRDQHAVLVQAAAGIPVAVDSPQAEAYPVAVPPAGSWPGQVVSPAGALTAWRLAAGPTAIPYGLRWTPLVNDWWFVTGRIEVRCGGEPCGTVYGEIPLDYETGALGTGETPSP